MASLGSLPCEPDALYIDIGVVKALLSEKGALHPSDFENAARVFLQTLIGRYAPPEDLPEDADDAERVKYRWGHQAMDIFRRRMKFEGKRTSEQKSVSGRRAKYVQQLLKGGYERKTAWRLAWNKFPAIPNEGYAAGESYAINESESEESREGIAVQTEPESKVRKATIVTDDAPEVPLSYLEQQRQHDEEKIAEWNRKIPNAEKLKEYILQNIAQRLNKSNLSIIMNDPNAVKDVYQNLVSCDWRSSKTHKIFSSLAVVVPWLIQNYRDAITNQKRGDKRIAEQEFEIKAADAETMDHDDIETYRARRNAAAEKASMEWQAAHAKKN